MKAGKRDKKPKKSPDLAKSPDPASPGQFRDAGKEIARRLQCELPVEWEREIGPDGEECGVKIDFYGSADEFHDVLGEAAGLMLWEAVHRVERLQEYVHSVAQAIAWAVTLNPDRKAVDLELEALMKGPLASSRIPGPFEFSRSPKARVYIHFRRLNRILLRVRKDFPKEAITREVALEKIGERSPKTKQLLADDSYKDENNLLLDYLIGAKLPRRTKETESPQRRVAAVLAARIAKAEGIKMSPATLLRWVVDARAKSES